MTTFNPAVLGMQNVCVGVCRCQKWIRPARAALKHKGIFLRQVQRNKRDVLLRGFHATEKTGGGRREGRACVYSSSTGHQFVRGSGNRKMVTLESRGSCCTSSHQQEAVTLLGSSCWESSRANDALPGLNTSPVPVSAAPAQFSDPPGWIWTAPPLNNRINPKIKGRAKTCVVAECLASKLLVKRSSG